MDALPQIVPAAVTAFSPGGERVLLDFIPQHFAYLEHHGADGVLVLGTNGEGVSLSLEERRDVIDAAMTHRGRLTVFAGTGCTALPETIELSNYAVERGVDAVMIVPPFFFNEIAAEGLIAYYASVLAELPAERKVILYNIPSFSGVEISDGLVDALLAKFPERLLGIKDTSGDVERTRAFIKRYPQLAIYNGNDRATALAARAGAAGAISGTANVFPDRVAAAWRAAGDGRDGGAAQRELTKACDVIARFPAQSAIKHLLQHIAGLPLVHVRPPLSDLTPEQAEALADQARDL